MANTDRRKNYIDRNGNMFVPMNVEGGVWNEHFITTPKFICIVLIVLSLVLIIMYQSSKSPSPGIISYAILLGGWALLSSLVVRFVIFEEKFYYKMYKERQAHEISTPALFWDISSIKDTDEGAILTYSDAKIAVIVKLERDTITGKNSDFQEAHYDAISDFYRTILDMKYSFVQMNVMEPAGKDPRLNELAKLVNKSDNSSVNKLMELQVGHIKNITNTTLYEGDYFIFYTNDLSKVDKIIEDAYDALFKLLDGAYIGFSILDRKEIGELVKGQYGVKYFNSTQASLLMFDNLGAANMHPITLSAIVWTDGNEQKLTSAGINKLRVITSDVIRGTKNIEDVSLKDTLYEQNKENNIGISFESLSDVEPKRPQNVQRNNGATQAGNMRNNVANVQANRVLNQTPNVQQMQMQRQMQQQSQMQQQMNVQQQRQVSQNINQSTTNASNNTNFDDDSIIDF